MEKYEKVFSYTNRKGDVYYFRKTDTGRGGKQIVASQKCSADALTTIPRGMEIAETPNGKVSCRKKQKNNILSAEIRTVKAWIPRLKKQAFVEIEIKPNAIVVYSAPIPHLPFGEFGVFTDIIISKLPKDKRKTIQKEWETRQHAELAKVIHYEPAVKFELHDQESRTFALYRMCHLDARPDWMFLSMSELKELAANIMPHLEQESFFELM